MVLRLATDSRFDTNEAVYSLFKAGIDGQIGKFARKFVCRNPVIGIVNGILFSYGQGRDFGVITDVMRFLVPFFLSCIAITAEARAEVFELSDTGETVNVTTPRWRTVNPVAASPAVPGNSAALTQVNYHPIVSDAASRYALNPALLDAVIRQESGYRINAVSQAGAIGLMQLMPGTARSLGVTNAFDPVQNVNGGAAYLRMQLNRFGGNVEHALAAYNAGPGAVLKHGGIPPYRETQIYVNTILGRLAIPVPAGQQPTQGK